MPTYKIELKSMKADLQSTSESFKSVYDRVLRESLGADVKQESVAISVPEINRTQSLPTFREAAVVHVYNMSRLYRGSL